MRILCLMALAAFASMSFVSQSKARELVVDLSKTIIPITTSFTGSDLLLFGSFINDNASDIIVVVRGPYQDEVVRRKERIMGVWANGDEITFKSVPSFYYVASNRPIAEFLDAGIARQRQIGINSLDFSMKYPDLVSKHVKLNIDQFRAGLIRTKQHEGLFGTKTGQVFFKGDKLFRSTLHFPANVPVGEYAVDVFVFRDNRIIDEHTTQVWVQKFGVEATIYDFANRHSLSYGIIAVLLAVASGWLASVMFRKS